MKPLTPLDRRAVKYFSFPGHYHVQIKSNSIACQFETATDIRPDSWISPKLEMNNLRVRAFVDDQWAVGEHDRFPPPKGPSGFGWTLGAKRISEFVPRPPVVEQSLSISLPVPLPRRKISK